MTKGTLIFILYLVAAVTAQLVFGAFPVTAFEFPVNSAVLFAGIVGLWVLYRERPDLGLSRWLASGKTSVLLILAFLACCLVLGMVTQLSPAEIAAGDSSGFVGVRDVAHAWWFIAITMALMANLLVVIFSRAGKTRFLLNHVGVFLALAGGFFGAPDTEILRIPVYEGKASREAFTQDGRMETLSYDLSMETFVKEADASGGVRNYKATVSVGESRAEIRVNHPYRKDAFEDIYLVSYDKSHPEPEYCVLEIVRQPWKYIIWLGVVMMMAGCVLMFAQGAEKQGDKI